MSPITTAGIIIAGFAVICIILFLMGLRQALRYSTLTELTQKKILFATSLVIIGWMILLGFLANQQVFSVQSFPPRPMLTVAIALIVILALSFTPAVKQILQATPLHWLIFFQAFRIGVELWFWYAYQSEVFPRIMTFEGANMDVISGLLAIATGFLILKQPHHAKRFTIIFNIVGIIILLNTLRAAALSMPSPIQQYSFDDRLLLLGQPYFIYLPGILVVMALGCHILSLRQISLRYKSSHKNAAPVTL